MVVGLKKLEPCLVDGPLGVHDDAIEIEKNCVESHGDK